MQPLTAEPGTPAPPAPAIAQESPGENWVGIGAGLVAAMILTWSVRARIIGPQTLRRRGVRDVSFQPTIMWFAAALGVYFFAFSGPALALVLLGPAEVETLRFRGFATLVSYGLGIAGCVVFGRVFLRPKAERSPEWLAVQPLDAPGIGSGGVWILASLPAILAVASAAVWIHVLWTSTKPDALAHESLKMMVDQRADPWTWCLILGAVIGAPVIEEHVYRCFLQSGLIRSGLAPGVAVGVVSVVFAGVHLSAVPVHALPPLLVLGVCLGLAYERTQKLIVPITMHALFNAGNIALAFMQH